MGTQSDDSLRAEVVSHVYIGEFLSALSLLNELIDIRSVALPRDYFTRGIVHHRMGSFALAIADWDEYVRLTPTAPPFHLLYFRGLCHKRLSQFEEAISDLEQASLIRPTEISTISHLGSCHLSLSHFSDAISHFNVSIPALARLNRRTEFCEDLYDRACASYQLNDHRAAYLDFSRILLTTPNDPQSLLYRGFCLYALGHYRRAAQDFDRSLRLRFRKDVFLAVLRTGVMRLRERWNFDDRGVSIGVGVRGGGGGEEMVRRGGWEVDVGDDVVVSDR